MRFDLSDEEWGLLEPLMPSSRKTIAYRLHSDDPTVAPPNVEYDIRHRPYACRTPGS